MNSAPWVKMRGPFGGIIQTSEGPSVVAEDGSFWVPPEDVQAMINKGAFLSGTALGSVVVGDYTMFQDSNGNLKIQAADGTTLELFSKT